LVSLLVASVVVGMLLHSIVSEMNVEVVFAEVKLLAAGADVALPKEVQVHVMCEQHPNSYIVLPAVHEHRTFDVLLDHKRFRFDVLVLVGQDIRSF